MGRKMLFQEGKEWVKEQAKDAWDDIWDWIDVSQSRVAKVPVFETMLLEGNT